MCSKPQRGFTLIEMILAIVIISVAIAGTMAAFTQSTLGSADPIVRKQLLVVAEEIMEEIELKPYANTPTIAKVTSGCARTGFYQVDHYQNYTTTNQICDADGNVITDLNGYTLDVHVVGGTLGTITEALLITVKVTKGSESITLTGWRTKYAS
jgi:MSHA pilin protein MshD